MQNKHVNRDVSEEYGQRSDSVLYIGIVSSLSTLCPAIGSLFCAVMHRDLCWRAQDRNSSVLHPPCASDPQEPSVSELQLLE